MNTLMGYAKKYASLGLKVFPLYGIKNGKCTCGKSSCPSPGKHPRIKDWQNKATTDMDVITEWFEEWPDSNIGIITGRESGLFILDIDNKPGHENDFDSFMDYLGSLSNGAVSTPCVLTGGGGIHYYYKMPANDLINSVGKIAPHVDTRTSGGYVVAPPSNHISGDKYEWLTSFNHEILQEVPQELIDKLGSKTEKKTQRSIFDQSKSNPQSEVIPEGQRNDSLFSKGCLLRKYGWEEDSILENLLGINANCCCPPLDENEVLSIVESVMKYDSNFDIPYIETPRGIIYVKLSPNGKDEKNLIANFTARITAEINKDNGATIDKYFIIKINIKGKEFEVTVPANEFGSMKWVLEKIGPNAIIFSGYGIKDKVREAIQLFSGTIPKKWVYMHTGWRNVDGKDVFLIGNGAIGKDGFMGDIAVDLQNTVADYSSVEPSSDYDLIESVKCSFDILDLGSAHIMYPLFCCIYRAVLGDAEMSVHLVGTTGTGKSVLAALAQQHFGPQMSYTNLPSSWSSTANAIEAIAYYAKDCLLTIDDFVFNGIKSSESNNNKAERVFRGQGNGVGRQRLTRDSEIMCSKPSRALILSTGEDVPRGHSIRARMLILDVGREDILWDKVTKSQEKAGAGCFAKALFGFIQWLCNNPDIRTEKYHEYFKAFRQELSSKALHNRSVDIVASFYAVFKIVISFAKDIGVLSDEECDTYLENSRESLVEVMNSQSIYHLSADHAERFVELLASSLSCGRGYIVDKDGFKPDIPEMYGWQLKDDLCCANGTKIGWVDGDYIYLELDVSIQVARSLAGLDGLSVTPTTLAKRLYEKGYIQKERSRDGYKVRKTLEGNQKSVLMMHKKVLVDQVSLPKLRRGEAA